MNATSATSEPPVAARLTQMWTESLAWFASHSTQIALGLLLGALIVALLFGAKWIGARIVASDPNRNHWRSVIGKALSKTRLWFMVAVAAEVVTSYANAPPGLARIIHVFFVIAAALQAAIFARSVVLGIVEHRAAASGYEASLTSAMGIIRLLVTFALFAVALVLILSNLGVNVTGLVAGLGIGGIAIGLAAQGIFRDLFAALSILFDRPFVVGDMIKFGDVTGRVEAIGLKTTRIRSLDGEEVIMSNNRLLEEKLRNYHGIESRRIVLTVPLHYSNPSDKLALLSGQIEEMIGRIPDSRFGHALLTSFDANAVMFEVLLYSTKGEADVRDRVRHEAMAATLAHLDAVGVGLSYQASDKPG